MTQETKIILETLVEEWLGTLSNLLSLSRLLEDELYPLIRLLLTDGGEHSKMTSSVQLSRRPIIFDGSPFVEFHPGTR